MFFLNSPARYAPGVIRGQSSQRLFNHGSNQNKKVLGSDPLTIRCV